MADSVGQIGLDLVVNSNQFNKQMAGINGLAKKAGAALAAAFAVKKVVEFGASCIELGSDLAEVQNVVDVSFPAMSAQVDQFAKSAASSFGLSETMAKKFTGTFGAMSKAFGFSEKEAYDMSTALTGLAGDVASFYNISQDEAYTKLKSVFTGETETLKDLGVVMTQNALDAYAMANGFSKTTQQMSESEKVALRYKFVMDQLSLAHGDFARTSDSWANQIRVLKLNFDSIKATLGQGFINLFTPIVKAINVLLGKLATLANGFKSFTELITGKKSTAAAASGMGDLAGAADNATSSVGSVGNSAASAGKAAKKAAKDMKALMGFDQVNKLSKPTEDGGAGSSGGSGGVGGGNISVGAVDYGSMPKSDGSTLKLGKEYDALKQSIDNLRGSFGLFAGIVKDAFGWVWENILKPFGKWTITKVAPEVIDILAGAFKILSAILLAFKPIWMFIWDNFLKPIATFTGKVFIGALHAIATALNGLGNWMLNHQGVVTGIAVAFTTFFASFKMAQLINWSKNLGGLSHAFKWLGENIKWNALITQQDIKKRLTHIATTYKSAAATIKDTMAKGANAVANSRLGQATGAAVGKIRAMTIAQKAGSIAALGIVGAIAGLAIYMGKTGTSADQMAKKIEKFADNLATGITAFADKLPEMLPKIISSLTQVINSLVAAIPKLVPTIASAGVTLFSGLVGSLGQIIGPLVKAFTSVVSALVQAIPVLLPALLNAGITLFTALVQAVPKIIPPIVAAIPQIVTAIVGLIPTLVPTLLNAAITLFMALVQAIPKIIPPLVNELPTIINGIVGAIPTLVPALVNGGVTLFMALVQAIPKIIPPLVSAIPTIIAALVKGLITAGFSLVSAFGGLFLKAATAAKNKFKDIKGWFGEKFKGAYEAAKNAFQNIGSWAKDKYDAVKTGFGTVKNWFGEKFKGAYDSVTGAFKNAGSWARDKYNSIKGKFAGTQNFFSDSFSKGYKGMTGAFKGVGTFFGNLWKNNIRGKFDNLGTKIGDAIGKSFHKAINSVLRTVERAINGGINIINGAIGMINKILPGEWLGKIGKVSLPRLAQGGYVKANTPQLAMIGDNRHQGEVVAPEDKLQEMAMEAAKAVGGSGGISKAELESILNNMTMRIIAALEAVGFYVDSEELARLVKKGQRKRDRRYLAIDQA